MATQISPLSQVDSRASLGDDVEIGPFCVVGPDVVIGDRTRLDSNAVIIGPTTLGTDNHIHAGAVIGGDPQDLSYSGSPTRLEIGDGNIFREGVTVSRGAEKEDHVTRIGDNNVLMANCHVAHNCHLHNNIILINGALLGGHVHVQDGVIVSGNSAVHQFSTLGTLCFISGVSRVQQDVPPYMLWMGTDSGRVRSVNVVGMKRRGISVESIRLIKHVHRLFYREHKSIETITAIMEEKLQTPWPIELTTLVNYLSQRDGRSGRRRDGLKAA